MTENDLSEILDGLFHGSTFAAFLEQAQLQQGWPCQDATRQRAYRIYEEELAARKR